MANDLADRITKVLAIKKWQWRKEYCVPRCYLLGWEADLLVLPSNKMLEEVEVKISLADFKADFINKKAKHVSLQKGRSPLSYFWFAVPTELVETVKPLIPDYAGLLSVHVNGLYSVTVIKKAPLLRGSKKLNQNLEIKLLRLAYLRIWK